MTKKSSAKEKKALARPELKSALKKLKGERIAAVEARDAANLKKIRRSYKKLARQLRRTPAPK